MVDPFCGSGSLLIGAHRANRLWIGIDDDFETVNIARHRIAVLPRKVTEWM